MSLNLAAPPGIPGAKASPGRLPEGGDGAAETGGCFSIKIYNGIKYDETIQHISNYGEYGDIPSKYGEYTGV